MNKNYLLVALPILVLFLAVFAVAEQGSDDSSVDDDDTSVDGVSGSTGSDDSKELSDPFAADSSTAVDVEDALDENDLEDEINSAIAGETSSTHTISYGQGYLVSTTGQISLLNGFWNVITKEELSKGRGHVRIAGVPFALKATKLTDTMHSFDLYRGDRAVGTMTFTQTKKDENNAIWNVEMKISTTERSTSATGVFATVTRTVTRETKPVGRTPDGSDEVSKVAREEAKTREKIADEEAKLADNQARTNAKIEKRWWQFWKKQTSMNDVGATQ